MERFKFYCPLELMQAIEVGAVMMLIAVSQDQVQINHTLHFIAPIKRMHTHRDGFTTGVLLKK